MTEEKKDRKEDLLDLGVPVDSPEESQDEFEVYRSLGYLSTGDVIQSTGFTKNELFYLLSTGFPIIKPIRIPLQGLGKELNAYLFSDRDLYILTLVKRMKEKYSLQQIRGMFSKLEYYSFIKGKLDSFDGSLGGLTPGEEFWKEREELIKKSSVEHYFAKTNNDELSKQLGNKAGDEWKFLESNISEIVQKIIDAGGEKLIEDLGFRTQKADEIDPEFPF